VTEHSADVAIVGAGIVGLAHALAAARLGKSVVVFERSDFSVGASVRNFGLVWPIGQPFGKRQERAMRSREIWIEVATQSQLHLVQSGSLHLVHRADELAVVEEFASQAVDASVPVNVLTASEALALSPVSKPQELLGAMWSPLECVVDPRQAIRTIPHWMSATFGVAFRFGTAVTEINQEGVVTASERWRVDHTIVCTGADFETLFPAEYAESGIIKVKLQMMRTVPQPDGWVLGPALCAGLTLLHYDAFTACGSRQALLERVAQEQPEYLRLGIHVLASQTRLGEITLGDSHAYGLTHEPFDDTSVNRLILDEFNRFAHLPAMDIAETWHGIYPKLEGHTEFIHRIGDQVTIVNGLGGAGMTLSFGLAEEVLQWLM
jgi:FAD dependent oxidoreductase TIGR03364